MIKTLVKIWLVFLCFTICSCSKKAYLSKIGGYLNAATVEAKSAYMAEDYRSYFLEKKGEGENKAEALASFRNWDGVLNPDVKILAHTQRKNSWTVQFNEQNDFSKLIGYPGWKGSMEIRFTKAGLIQETTYIPGADNLPYKPNLQPALDWLQQNMPEQLREVYQNYKLVKTEEAAKKWVILLTAWRDQE